MTARDKIQNRIIQAVYHVCLEYGKLPDVASKELIGILMKESDQFLPLFISEIIDSVFDKNQTQKAKSYIKASIMSCMDIINDYMYFHLELPYKIPEIFNDEKFLIEEFINYYLRENMLNTSQH